QLPLIQPNPLASAAAVHKKFHEPVALEAPRTFRTSPRAFFPRRGRGGLHVGSGYFNQLAVFRGEIEIFRAALGELGFLARTIIFVLHGSPLVESLRRSGPTKVRHSHGRSA